MSETITFSEYSLGTTNPLYNFDNNSVQFFGVIVQDGAQPATPVIAANASYDGPVLFGFESPVSSVSLDAGYFNSIGSTQVEFRDASGSIIAVSLNTTLGVETISFGSLIGISEVWILNVDFDVSGFSVDTVIFGDPVEFPSYFIHPTGDFGTPTDEWFTARDFLEEVTVSTDPFYGRLHLGDDLNWGNRNDDANEEVYSIYTGKVANIYSDYGGAGSAILVYHTMEDGSKYTAVYGHVDPSVSIGDEVAQGTQLGTLHDWTADHLHFNVAEGHTLAARAGYVDPTDAGSVKIGADGVNFSDIFVNGETVRFLNPTQFLQKYTNDEFSGPPTPIVLNSPDTDIISGTLTELDGLRVFNFSDEDKIIFESVEFVKENVTITYGSAILEIDFDNDGVVDSTVVLEGDFESAELIVNVVVGNTEISFEFLTENLSPTAFDDAFSVDEDQTLSGNVLEDNGHGADGDPDGDSLMVSLISGPTEGILTLNDDGSFSYKADADVFDLAAPGDVIEQSFTYQIDDRNGKVDQATATISVIILDDGKTICAKNGKDKVIGTDGGEDILKGGNGKDQIFGLDGADHLFGGNGKDMLDGGEGPDKLYGGNGKDTLIGGLGADELTGGKGNDTFVFALGDGADTVLDYKIGKDLIGLDGLTFGDLSIGQAGDDATISSNWELLAVLTGVKAAALSESDFFNFV